MYQGELFEKNCAECGVLFKGHPQAKYCDNCRETVRARQRLESKQRALEYRKLQPVVKPSKPKKKPKSTIAEIAKAAKNAGMSYGEFVLKNHL